MTNRKTSLLLGYARRMQEVARLATEMKDIQTQFEREFGVQMTDGALQEVLTGARLARLADELRAGAPSAPPREQEPAENVSGGTSTAPGAALGLAPAPQWLQDGFGDELTTAEKRTREGLVCVGCVTNAGPHSEVAGVCARV